MSHCALRTKVKHFSVVRHVQILLFTEFAEKPSFKRSESDQKETVECSLSHSEGW